MPMSLRTQEIELRCIWLASVSSSRARRSDPAVCATGISRPIRSRFLGGGEVDSKGSGKNAGGSATGPDGGEGGRGGI